MRRYIRLVTIIPRISLEINTPSQLGNILRRRQNPIHSIDVIFRADMHIPHRSRWQSGYRVVVMRRAVVAAVGLVRDVLAQHGAGDARGAIRVEIGGRAPVPDLGGGDGGDGAAETVPYDDHLVLWVCGGGGVEGAEDVGACLAPAVVAVVDFSISKRGSQIGKDSVKDATYKPLWQ